jgi:hypothetical protein
MITVTEPRIEERTARYESYLTNPQEQPDPAKWETEVAIKVAD